MRARPARHSARLLSLGLVAAGALLAQRAQAAEGGASFYVLGTGGPGVAIMPPVPGVFFANTAFYYHGTAGGDRQFTLGGNVVAGLRGTIAANFPTVVWVPQTKIAGGTLAVGGILPFGQPWVNADAVLTGPRGNPFQVSRGDTQFVWGDPALVANLGWTSGKTHVQVATLLNVPIGMYRENELANLAFHRWAGDLSVAATWHDPQSGWDVSGKTGFTFNGRNNVTDYRTGTEWHIEGAVEKQLTPKWALGAQFYHYHQVTGDSGSGARLGPFEGRVTGVGGTAAYNFKIGKAPATLRLHGISEFDAVNRLQGHTIMLDFTMPLAVHLPPGAHS